MFGPRISTVFTSRWKALGWAAMVLATAWCTVPAPEETVRPEDTASTQAALRSVLGDAARSDAPAHANPWSRNAP